MSNNRNRNRNRPTGDRAVGGPAPLKVSESASDEMTEAILRKRAIERFRALSNDYDKREELMEITVKISDDSDDADSVANALEMFKIQKEIMGEDKEAVLKHFNRDASKIDAFIKTIMEAAQVKKG